MRCLVTFFCFVICSYSSAIADSERRREVRSWDEGQWAVVDIEKVTGTVVVLSPVVGQEIDFEERNRFGIFSGETVYNNKQKMSVLKTPVTGFQSAVFLKFSNEKYGVRVTFRNEMGVQHRLLHIADHDEMVRLRDYVEHAAGGEKEVTAYPLVTDEQVLFETVRPRFRPQHRVRGQLVLADGEKVKGELLPVMEEGMMLVDTKKGFRRVDVLDVQQVGIGGRGATGVVSKTVQGGVYYGVMGGVSGLMAGLFYEGVSAKEQMMFGAILGASVGGFFGFLDGLFSLKASKTFHLGSLDRKRGQRQLEVSPLGVKLRF